MMIGRFEFATKKAAEKIIQGIIDSGKTDRPECQDLLMSLVKMHPEYEDKIGSGISEIFVNANPIFNTRCFYVRRTDGSVVPFSYKACLKRKGASMSEEWQRAARHAVRGQIDTFKTMEFSRNPHPICPITKRVITWRKCHVDHIAPETFANITKSFLTLYDLTPSYAWLSKGADTTTIVDQNILHLFRDYHRRYAVLRLLSPEANMRLGSKP